MNILALCTGNSARSILLECLLRDLSGGCVTSFSAGPQPTGFVHPVTLSLLERHGHSVGGLRSKSWDEFAGAGTPAMDAVITVCDSAAAETCPFWPGAPVRTHWGIPDPVVAAGTKQENNAFETAYAVLLMQTKAVLDAGISSLSGAGLKAALNRAARIS